MAAAVVPAAAAAVPVPVRAAVALNIPAIPAYDDANLPVIQRANKQIKDLMRFNLRLDFDAELQVRIAEIQRLGNRALEQVNVARGGMADNVNNDVTNLANNLINQLAPALDQARQAYRQTLYGAGGPPLVLTPAVVALQGEVNDLDMAVITSNFANLPARMNAVTANATLQTLADDIGHIFALIRACNEQLVAIETAISAQRTAVGRGEGSFMASAFLVKLFFWIVVILCVIALIYVVVSVVSDDD